MDYKAGTYKEKGKFYPIIRFYGHKIADALYMNEAQETRAQHLQKQNNTLKNLKKTTQRYDTKNRPADCSRKNFG